MQTINNLTEEIVDKHFTRRDVLNALRTAFLGLATGTSQQPRQSVTTLPNSEGDCIFYPGLVWDLDLVGISMSPLLFRRVENGLSPVTSYTLLLSTKTGEAVLVCESELLITIRTAGTTMLAVEELLPANEPMNLAVIGAGPLGIEHARFAALTREWNSIVVASPSVSDKTSPKYQQRVAAIESIGYNVRPSPTIEEAVRGADVVMLCTSSENPVVKRSWLSNCRLITSIGTNAPMAHEFDPKWLPEYAIFCDFRETAPVTAGEMILAIDSGKWSATSIIADLPELVNGAKKEYKGPLYFRSTGLGIEDVAIAGLLVPKNQ
jgi:L-arginine dehydrogenase